MQSRTFFNQMERRFIWKRSPHLTAELFRRGGGIFLVTGSDIGLCKEIFNPCLSYMQNFTRIDMAKALQFLGASGEHKYAKRCWHEERKHMYIIQICENKNRFVQLQGWGGALRCRFWRLLIHIFVSERLKCFYRGCRELFLHWHHTWKADNNKNTLNSKHLLEF